MACFESLVLGCHRYLVRYLYWWVCLILVCLTFEWYSVTSLTLGGNNNIWITQAILKQKLLPEKIEAWRQLIAILFLYAEFLLPSDRDEFDERFQYVSILLHHLNSLQRLTIRRLTSLCHMMTSRDRSS
jgi:hypothetical protein